MWNSKSAQNQTFCPPKAKSVAICVTSARSVASHYQADSVATRPDAPTARQAGSPPAEVKGIDMPPDGGQAS